MDDEVVVLDAPQSEEQTLIEVKQAPVIEAHIQLVKDSVEKKVKDALSLVVTEDTYQYVKKVRAELNKDFSEKKGQLTEAKRQILAPLEGFDEIWDIYKKGDAELKSRIAEIEDELKKEKETETQNYFEAYRESLGLDPELASYDKAHIVVGLSTSKKKLREQAKAFLDDIAAALKLIEVQAYRDEILVEYKKTLNISRSILAVNDRHAAIEAETRRREAMRAQEEQRKKAAEAVLKAAEAARVAEPNKTVAPPPTIHVPTPTPTVTSREDEVYSLSVKVYGTKDQLKAFKEFLINGGYEYEQQ